MTDSLYGRLKELEKSDFYPFHMPGHKRNFPYGSLLSYGNRLSLGSLPAWYSMDITEIDGFDDLHRPHGILLRSQQKAAQLYRAEETYFLINGSTAGVLSALSAVAADPAVSAKEKKVLISRNSHMSVYHGAYLNDILLEYLYPEICGEYDIALGLTAAAVKEKIRERNDIGAVLVTSPTYEGVVSDICGIAEVVHKQGIPLIVDQAHGAHFGFHPGYPENAVRQGADAVIHSLHKTLPAPTQTALLHVNSQRINRKALNRYLRIFQSSSPSYPLMAGIDFCLELLRDNGSEMLERLLQMRDSFQKKTKDLKYIKICDRIDDPCKVVISIKGTSFTGHKLAEILRDKYHLEMEMAGESYGVAVFSIMDKPEGINRLSEALCEIDFNLEGDSRETDQTGGRQEARQGGRRQVHPLETVMGIKEALEGMEEEAVPEEASGRIAAEFVSLCPPGIPILVPGERLDRNTADIISRYRREKLTVHGLSEAGKVKILKKESIK